MESVRIYTQSEFTHEPNWNSSFRLLFLLRGELSIFVGSKERRLRAHDFTFICPFELHGGSSGQDVCKALLIDISPDLWKTICPNADRLAFNISILRANGRQKAYTSICKSLAQAVYFDQASVEASPARICRAVSDILAILTENFAVRQQTQKNQDQTMVRVQDILQYIVAHYTQRISLEEISGAIGFHPQYFSVYFKKQFGVSFTDYLNNYRINRSIQLLRDTNDSILNIALACGFNNHKTYSNAFEKHYHCSPREYRRLLREQPQTDVMDLDEGDFDYLRRFWNRKTSDETPVSASSAKCSIQLDRETSVSDKKTRHIISLGRAMSCLRSDMQQQLIRAKQDLDLEYVRFRDIFSDDLFVYYEDRLKTPVFSWRALDEIFDFLIAADLKPFIEIGYMPGQMASRKQYAGWQYHPNVSSPKSMKLWELLVSSFLNHLIMRYGKETVEEWLFDFLTSPNLRLEHGYWNESMENFFRFYQCTYQIFRSIDPRIQFGSPNFSYPAGLGDYEDFFIFAKKHHLKPDFISTHLYSCGDGQETMRQRFIEYSIFDNNYSIPNIKPERYALSRAVRQLCDVVDRYCSPDLPVIIDDWNVTFFPTDFTRDTSFMGPFVVESFFNVSDRVYGMGFAALSDIHEDFFNTDQLFNGGPGLLTYTGIPKSSYYALSMAYRFTRHLLLKGENYVVGKTDSGYEILIYHMDFYNDDYVGNDPSVISFTNRYNVFEVIPDLDCHIQLPAEKGTYSVVRSLISRRCGSSYDAWVKMGSPSDITPEITRYLMNISTPEMSFETVNSSGAIILDDVLEPHSVLHIQISRV